MVSPVSTSETTVPAGTDTSRSSPLAPVRLRPAPGTPEPARRNAEAQSDDPDSILHLYRRLLAARRASPALRLGSWEGLDGPEDVLAYRRREGDG